MNPFGVSRVCSLSRFELLANSLTVASQNFSRSDSSNLQTTMIYLHLTHTAAVDALRVINRLFRRPRPKPPEENGGEENGGEENGGAVPAPVK